MSNELDAFLKDPKGYTRRKMDSLQQRRQDAQNYYERQCQILDEVLDERMAELDSEEAGIRQVIKQYVKEHEQELATIVDGDGDFLKWFEEEWERLTSDGESE